ncbi:MAG TPA: NADH-ubiquinone oxidoreductase-F iron-sulfur binding region domain-containing protein, partial [Acidimicrobiales bacterium]|nr:NADH-ubiquinone oxidoreductase-F iron-sulfur binding region domain-containing protein [Acidimicrobiales bacterium]
FVPPRPYERGVGGRPTLIQNTETVAHLGLVARHGADWFRAVGTPEEPGSTLVTLQGAFRGDGVYEVPRGIRLADLVTLAGGLAAPVQAYLIGGYSGAWLGADDAHDLPLDDPSLAAHGATVGVGVVLALPEAACGVAETARILRYLADETAGQCGPCVHGLAAIAGAADQLARGSAGRDVVERLEAWSWQVTGRGACHHPDGATRMLASALKAFAADVEAHRIGRPCAAAPPRRGPARPKPPRATPR